MKIWPCIRRFSTAALFALAGAAASAGPVTLTLAGHVDGYENIDLSTVGIANGSAVSLSLNFTETWSDGTYGFGDALGPVSGSMTVGSHSFTFNGGLPFAYAGFSSNVVWVEPQFVGLGPTLGGGEFFGLFLSLTPAMTLTNDVLLGYGFTSPGIISYGYARIVADRYAVTPQQLPAPATLPLLLLAVATAAAARRSRAAAA